MATIMYHLKLDAVLDAASNCLLLRLQGNSAPLPSAFTFYTGEISLVQVTVYFPTPGGSLFFDGTTYPDSDNNKIIVVQCAAAGEHEIEAFLPPATTTAATSSFTSPGSGGAETTDGEPPSLLRKPRAPSTRVKLAPKLGYPPSDGGDT